jgi:hypothetical protein
MTTQHDDDALGFLWSGQYSTAEIDAMFTA